MLQLYHRRAMAVITCAEMFYSCPTDMQQDRYQGPACSSSPCVFMVLLYYMFPGCTTCVMNVLLYDMFPRCTTCVVDVL